MLSYVVNNTSLESNGYGGHDSFYIGISDPFAKLSLGNISYIHSSNPQDFRRMGDYENILIRTAVDEIIDKEFTRRSRHEVAEYLARQITGDYALKKHSSLLPQLNDEKFLKHFLPNCKYSPAKELALKQFNPSPSCNRYTIDFLVDVFNGKYGPTTDTMLASALCHLRTIGSPAHNTLDYNAIAKQPTFGLPVYGVQTRKAAANILHDKKIHELNLQAGQTTDQNVLGELFLQGATQVLDKITELSVLDGILEKAPESQKDDVNHRINYLKNQALQDKIATTNDQNTLGELFLQGHDSALNRITNQKILGELLDKESSVPRKQKILSKIRDAKKLDEIIGSNMPLELRNQASQQRFGK